MAVQIDQRCPHDGGRCHHRCDAFCFRAMGGGQLSTPWPGFPVSGMKPVKGKMPNRLSSQKLAADNTIPTKIVTNLKVQARRQLRTGVAVPPKKRRRSAYVTTRLEAIARDHAVLLDNLQLRAVLKSMITLYPAFRNRPIGAPGSTEREKQSRHILVEEQAKDLLRRPILHALPEDGWILLSQRSPAHNVPVIMRRKGDDEYEWRPLEDVQ